jgi:hypothetical protein
VGASAQGPANRDPNAAKLVTSDIDLFWKAYDKATPANDLYVFRDEYLRKGSDGLKAFTEMRIGSSCNLVDAMAASPKYYAALRGPSLKVASYEPQIRASYRKLQEIVPDAVFPDVYFVIGRKSSAGTLTDKMLLIGVDMFGKSDPASIEELSPWLKAVVGSMDRLPYVVAHELIHYQQKYPRSQNSTLLTRSVGEGSADFIAELISGSHINPHLHVYGNPIEKELWTEFQNEMDGKDVANWLYQGDRAVNRPADLGYYMGYKIAESYYQNSKDKERAVRDILEIKDMNEFLAKSKYAEKFK